MVVAHPYYPVDLDIPGYAPNDWYFTTLLTIFGSGCASVLLTATLITKRTRPDLPTSEVLTILWFVLSGCLHLFFESYFVLNFNTLASGQTLFPQLWKEYAYSDSRYLTQDPFVLCIEAISVIFWGPLSLLTAYMILSSHPMRYGLQIIVSTAHLYGVVIYYTTSLAELYLRGVSHSRPEALYFWVYFVGFNAPWLLVPAALIWSALRQIGRAFEALGKKKKL